MDGKAGGQKRKRRESPSQGKRKLEEARKQTLPCSFQRGAVLLHLDFIPVRLVLDL